MGQATSYSAYDDYHSRSHQQMDTKNILKGITYVVVASSITYIGISFYRNHKKSPKRGR